MANKCVQCGQDFVDSQRHVCPVVPKDSDPFGPLDYVANMCYQFQCQQDKITPARWWALRDDLKTRYREAAIQQVSEWATPEMQEAALAGRLTVGGKLITPGGN